MHRVARLKFYLKSRKMYKIGCNFERRTLDRGSHERTNMNRPMQNEFVPANETRLRIPRAEPLEMRLKFQIGYIDLAWSVEI